MVHIGYLRPHKYFFHLRFDFRFYHRVYHRCCNYLFLIWHPPIQHRTDCLWSQMLHMDQPEDHPRHIQWFDFLQRYYPKSCRCNGRKMQWVSGDLGDPGYNLFNLRPSQRNNRAVPVIEEQGKTQREYLHPWSDNALNARSEFWWSSFGTCWSENIFTPWSAGWNKRNQKTDAQYYDTNRRKR